MERSFISILSWHIVTLPIETFACRTMFTTGRLLATITTFTGHLLTIITTIISYLLTIIMTIIGHLLSIKMTIIGRLLTIITTIFGLWTIITTFIGYMLTIIMIFHLLTTFTTTSSPSASPKTGLSHRLVMVNSSEKAEPFRMRLEVVPLRIYIDGCFWRLVF